jgi:hypothetical protein
MVGPATYDANESLKKISKLPFYTVIVSLKNNLTFGRKNLISLRKNSSIISMLDRT